MLHHNFITQEVRPNTIAEVKVDASFRKISKTAVCFFVWKIEEDRLEAEAKPHYGIFYDNCAYIIYAASPAGVYVNTETVTREANKAVTGTLERFIHFWLGNKVSEQKRSNVAHKIQELDSYFGNIATEYRESQNNESARFLSYFKKGITVRSGALANSSDPNRLFQLRGRKWMRSTEMENISWEHFSSDYVMVLKTESHVFVWLGRSSSTGEHRDAIDMASTANIKRNAEMTIIDDGYEQSMPPNRKAVWNSFLPLQDRIVSQTVPIGERQQYNNLKIYKCSYKGARLHLDQLDISIPTKQDLNDSKAVYVLDGSTQGIWLWIGNRASHKDNISAMANGRAFVKKKKYPNPTPIIRVVEGHEPVEFIRLFPNWPCEWYESAIIHKSISTMLGKFDALTLYQRPKLAGETQLIDSGSGERIIYQITKNQLSELSKSKVVMFTTTDCYVVQYTVKVDSANPVDVQNVGVKTIVYQWFGASASRDVTKKCERFAKGLFESLNEKTMYAQMCEYDELPHFLQIFDGCLIIMQSDRDIDNNSIQSNKSRSNSNNSINNISNYSKNSIINNNNNNSKTNSNNNINNINNNIKEHINSKSSNSLITENSTITENFVLKVYGDASYNSKAVEIFPLNSMNSKECYIVKTNQIWVWCGQQSTGDSREVAKKLGALLGESCLVLEGMEPKDFWRSMSHQMMQPVNTNGNAIIRSRSNSISLQSNGSNSPQHAAYINNSTLAKSRVLAQLYLVWLDGGKFFSQEIIGYDQCDLSPEYVYILDAASICYMWIGEYAPKYEQSKYLKITHRYLDTVPIARGSSTAVAIVRQHNEPNTFKGLFENWDHGYWNNYVTYQQKRQLFTPNTDANSQESINGSNDSSPVVMNSQNDFDRHHKYPINVLQQEMDLLPAEVNPLKREVHLTHDDFVSLFNMSFWQFDALPVWKKQELKKKYKVF